MTDIAVIIPVHNRRVQLVRAIKSVLAQTRRVSQIIVVDDGSDDDPAAFIQSQLDDARIEVVQQSNQGVSRARNTGLHHARHEWIAFLDSDDEWLPEKIEQQSRYLVANPQVFVCHTDEIWIRNGKRVNQMNKHRKFAGRIYQHCLPLCAMSPSSVLVHRRVLHLTGGFDENLPACEDYDLWLRVSAHFDVGLVDAPLLRKYGGHSDQLSARHWGMDRFRVIALRRMLQDDHHRSSLSDQELRQTVSLLCKKLRILISGARKRGNTEQLALWSDQLVHFEQEARALCE